MTERAILIAVAAILVVAVILFLRRRPIVRARPLTATGLPPGTYLLTSDGCCDTCRRARERLTRRQVSYTELSWEKNPDVFERLAIDAVPSVLRIEAGGEGIWWRGGVPRLLGESTRPGGG